jgi:uncharacterized iron-regulated membrane protein
MAARNGLWATLRWVHRWLGLTLGLVFTAVALSGSLLLFQPQFFEWAHGEMIPDSLAQKPGSVDAWVANGRAAVPELGDPIAIWRPHVSHNVSDAGMLIFAGLEPGGLGNMGFAGVLIAPATGEVLGTFEVDRSPAYAPLFFHRNLWVGETGKIICGVMAVGSLISLSIGLYLWWPPRNRIMHKLSPRPWRTTLTNAVRLHDLTGIWMLAALLMLVTSGLYLVQPGWVEPALSILPDAPEEARAASTCGAPIDFDAALTAARDLVPNGEWTAIYPHDEEQGTWEIAMRTGSDTDAEHGDVRVLADLRCGTVQSHETAATRPPRHTAEVWLVGLHDGSIFGLSGEIVVALLGLTPLVLAWTGIRMWLRGRQRRARGRAACTRNLKRPHH